MGKTEGFPRLIVTNAKGLQALTNHDRRQREIALQADTRRESLLALTGKALWGTPTKSSQVQTQTELKSHQR